MVSSKYSYFNKNHFFAHNNIVYESKYSILIIFIRLYDFQVINLI